METVASGTGTCAAAVAEYLAEQGITRVFSLPGSHMKPIWAQLRARGVRIVTARHEVAAVHMAQAEADLRHGLAVALVTTGPGLTNAISGVACAYLAGSPVLVISTRPPDEQEGMGALEEIDQAAIAAPVCRGVEVVRSARHVVDRLDRAVSAALGDDGPSGPAYLELSTDLLRRPAARTYTDYPRRERAARAADPVAVTAAAEVIAASARPLVIAGREALRFPGPVRRFVESIGAVYLDTRESRGSLSDSVDGYVPALRARAMAEADLVITLGRRLDFEVAYGSPAVFAGAHRFLRVGRTSQEVQANRRGDVELRADTGSALEALLAVGASPRLPDTRWREALLAEDADKRAKHLAALSAVRGDQTGLHPLQVIDAVNNLLTDDTVVVVDGGDVLSWSRSSLRTPTYLDLGGFGCLGVGVPFAVAASLNRPEQPVVAVVGDGALGFNVMELETAVREDARLLVVVVDNAAWNIERRDQVLRYDGEVAGTELGHTDYAALAGSLGVAGFRVDSAADLADTLARAAALPRALVDVRVSREPVSPDSHSGLALVPDLHVLTAWDDVERSWSRGAPVTADE